MNVEGSHSFAASRALTWEMLLDPEVLKAALPGCETFLEVAPEQYKVTLTVSLIAFTAKVTGDVSITDRVAPDSYRVLVSGSGSLGSLNVDVKIRLTGDAPVRVDYALEITADGALGMLGAPVIEPAAKMIMGQFWGALEKQIVARTVPPAPSP